MKSILGQFAKDDVLLESWVKFAVRVGLREPATSWSSHTVVCMTAVGGNQQHIYLMQ